MVSRSVFSFAPVFCIALAGIVFASCSPSPPERLSEAAIDFLASDAHVIVGDTPLVLPFVALKDYVSQGLSFSLDKQKDRQAAKVRLEAFRQVAAAPQTAPVVPSLWVSIYGAVTLFELRR